MKTHPTKKTDWAPYETIAFAVVMYSSELGWINFATPASPAEAHERYDACDSKNKMLLNFGSIVREEHEPEETPTTTPTPPTPTPATPKQWTSTAGPIQTKKVKKVFGTLRMEQGHYIEKTGIIGVSEDSHGYYMLFGGSREDVSKAQLDLGEEFGWTVTRENYSRILERATAVLAELSKNAPVKDKRITPEQHAADEAERSEWKRKQIETLAKLRGTTTEFQATIKRLSNVTNKTEDGIYGWWLEYSANCASGDMSPVLGEFVEHYRAKLGSYPEALQRALIAPAAPATCGKTEAVGTRASVKLNARLGGVELWFAEKPDDATIAKIKSRGFRPSRIGGWHWYKKQSPEAVRFAHEVAGTEVPAETAPHDGGMCQAQEDAYQDNQARMIGA